MNGFPSAADFQGARVTQPGQSEIIRQSLYDNQILPGAGSTQLNFFQQPIGQGITSALGATAATAKTQFDTNMSLGGQLPSGLSVLIESHRSDVLPGVGFDREHVYHRHADVLSRCCCGHADGAT
jgi:hypothetical protein